jgi:1,4-dihydroxy-2-naphthoate octaprenyltransferase
MDLDISRFILKITKPFNLLGGVLVYALGVSIARYLGNPIDWALVVFGQVWVTAYQLGSNYLEAYFRQPTKSGDPSRFQIEGNKDEPHDGLRRDLILWASFAAFTAMTSITLVMFQSGGVHTPSLMVMGILLLGVVLNTVPPFILTTSGYGELVQSILIASLIPVFGYILQNKEIHRLVAMSTFPITMLHLAMAMAHQLQKYSFNVRNGYNTLLVRLGWERGMTYHNILLLGSFVLIGFAMLFGFPTSIAMPVFTVLPLTFFQIWYLNRIAAGAKPNWRVLNLTATLNFYLPVYLLVFRFLTR